jgi:hypothetical protein
MINTTTTIGVRNILAVYSLASRGEVVEGREWYDRAYKVAESIATEHGLQTTRVAAVIAALSPSNRWSRNMVDAENLVRAFVIGGRAEAENVKCATYGKMKEKAIQILEADPDSYESILKGQKITAFWRCIIGDQNTVCVDGHAYCIWFGDRMTLADVPNIGKRMYAEITDDYVEAARILTESGNPITCYEVQAVTWVAWRRLHGVTK